MRAIAVLLIGMVGCATSPRVSVPAEAGTFAHGASSEAAVEAQSSLEAEIIAAQQAQIAANNSADIASLDRLTADEYGGVNASGTMHTKAEFLQDVERRGPAAVKATPLQLLERQKEWRVRVCGTAGIVTRLTAGDHGSRSWVTAVWVKRDGQWLRVFGQVTTTAVK